MLRTKDKMAAATAPATYSFGEDLAQLTTEDAMALLALSHTAAEHLLYSTMMTQSSSIGTRVASFTNRELMTLTGISSYSGVRRGLTGLVNKLSIERQKIAGANGYAHPRIVYLVFTPLEIIERRRAAGLAVYPSGNGSAVNVFPLGRAAKSVADIRSLSRREAQVALCCAEGLTNAQIGERLEVSEQTVKFHLRNIFIKFGVKRRAELVSRLFREGGASFVL